MENAVKAKHRNVCVCEEVCRECVNRLESQLGFFSTEQNGIGQTTATAVGQTDQKANWVSSLSDTTTGKIRTVVN